MDVPKPSIDLAKIMKLAMLSKNVLFYSLDLCVLSRKELYKVEEARFVFGLIVVPILDLTLKSSKGYTFLTSAGMGAINDSVFRLMGGEERREGEERRGGGGEERGRGGEERGGEERGGGGRV